MKTPILAFLFAFLLSACNGWVFQPGSGPTPFLPPTPTPRIHTPTPVVIGVNTSTPTAARTTDAITPTNSSVPNATDTAIFASTSTLTGTPSGPSISINVLGCDTSIDVTHGMGEVTNSYVTLKNSGGTELTNLKATLFALDEGREHPDKTVELTALPIGYQVTIKLTVDSTYREETPVQVEVTSDQGLFPREGLASCTDIGLFMPSPESLNTPIPNVP